MAISKGFFALKSPFDFWKKEEQYGIMIVGRGLAPAVITKIIYYYAL